MLFSFLRCSLSTLGFALLCLTALTVELHVFIHAHFNHCKLLTHPSVLSQYVEGETVSLMLNLPEFSSLLSFRVSSLLCQFFSAFVSLQTPFLSFLHLHVH